MIQRNSPNDRPATVADEWLPLVDANGTRFGKARRCEAHGNPALLHPVVHCLVQNSAGALLLQLRGAHKDVQPGRWDTSVGGHVGLDESIEAAVLREIREEIGLEVEATDLRFLYRYVMRNSIESELVHTFSLAHEGPFRAEPTEIDDLRFWSTLEIEPLLGSGCFTPNFEDEFARYSSLEHRV
jgi:isopentenyldiphosphate isomerase